MELPDSARVIGVNAMHSPAPNPVGAQELHQQTILSSHERSRAFGLQPQYSADLARLDAAALRDLQLRNARLCAQALPVMEMLYEQLTHAQSMVVLTDASGVVLQALGDAGFLQRAQTVALAPGAMWSEASKGTNAIGTALMTERATLVHGQEHFMRSMQFLTCSAAPVFDHKGVLLGVIDVSGDRRSYHPHTLALAAMAARLIENQWFADKFRHHLRLHFHTSGQSLGTLHECVLALDDSGGLLGANRRALEALGTAATHLRRESLASLFGTSVGALIDHTHRHPDQPLPLNLRRNGQPGDRVQAKLSLGRERTALDGPDTSTEAHLSIELPTVPPAAPSAAVPRDEQTARGPLAAEHAMPGSPAFTLRDAELKAIQAALDACNGNLSLAARQLGIGRSTLYRKIKGGGLVSSAHE